jgi:hypothetical protein
MPIGVTRWVTPGTIGYTSRATCVADARPRPHAQPLPSVAMEGVRARAVRGGAAARLIAAICVSAAAGYGAGHLTARAAAPSAGAAPVAVRPCRLSQLDISYFGSSGAAGTAMWGFGVSLAEGPRCSLDGFPEIRLETGQLAHLAPLAPSLASDDAAMPGAGAGRPIMLASSHAAGFVLTSRDFGQEGDCPEPPVTSISVSLPHGAGSLQVPLADAASDCGGGASVSAFMPVADLRASVLPVGQPLCSNSQLSGTVVAGGGYAGHLETVVVLHDRSRAPCELFGYAALRPLLTGRGGSATVRLAATEIDGAPVAGDLIGGTPTAPLVRLRPGATASFDVVSSDFPSGAHAGASGPCPSYLAWSVSVQSAGTPLRLPAHVLACGPLLEYPFVAGSSGAVTTATAAAGEVAANQDDVVAHSTADT